MSSVPDDITDYLLEKCCLSLAGESNRGKVKKRMFSGVVSTTRGEQQWQETSPSASAGVVCSENGRS